jgi:hypothetical protein
VLAWQQERALVQQQVLVPREPVLQGLVLREQLREPQAQGFEQMYKLRILQPKRERVLQTYFFSKKSIDNIVNAD